jgi:hypothetical protein
MNVFFLDLWHDLKEKRLWPAAAALLVGLIAVPVLLAKPAGPASAPAPVPQVAPSEKAEALEQLAQVKLGNDEVGDGSTLGVFDPDDPFKPPKGAIKKQETVDSATSAGPATGTPSGSDAGSGGTGGGATGDTGTTTGDTGGTTGDTGGTGGDTHTTTTVYKYVVDVTFEANGRTRHIKGMEKLDMLPSQDNPLLIFMGVTANGGNAVFMVDSTLRAAGEGKCKPSANQCALAYIGAGSEYMFRNEEGDTYRVKIDEIRKVKVSPDGSAAKAGTAKSAKAHAAVGAPRRFVPPSFADEVVVASETLADSNSNADSR